MSLTSEYAHPIEFYFTNIIPVAVGYKILGAKIHFVTIVMWVIFRVAEAVDGHCGYEFSFSPFRVLPMSGSATFHNYHHTRNVGNYGSMFIVWDTLMKTNASYLEYDEKR